MTSLAFLLSLLALLFAPGPTNALLALSGAEVGAWRTLRLLPVVLVAYGAVVVPLAAVGGDLLGHQHGLRAGITLAAALWVAWLAVALWRHTGQEVPQGGSVTALKLFLTTLLNPKALIIGLVLIPGQPGRGMALAAFLAMLCVAAACWVMLGAALRGSSRSDSGLALMRRCCAGWLGLLALMLGSAALSA